MTAPSSSADGLVVMGRVAGLFGVRGWVKVYAYTRERTDILAYGRWWVQRGGWREYRVAESREHGKGIVARFEGIEDRDQAQELVGAEIAVRMADLPPLAPGEYYWAQLEGLNVVTLAGVTLGRVDHLLETGANDVIVVQGDRERLIPYVPDVVREVDLDAGVIRVDWDPEF